MLRLRRKGRPSRRALRTQPHLPPALPPPPRRRWDGGNNPEQTDFVSVANLVRACPPSLRRFVLTTSAGVERSGQFPFSILNLFGGWGLSQRWAGRGRCGRGRCGHLRPRNVGLVAAAAPAHAGRLAAAWRRRAQVQAHGGAGAGGIGPALGHRAAQPPHRRCAGWAPGRAPRRRRRAVSSLFLPCCASCLHCCSTRLRARTQQAPTPRMTSTPC